VCLIKHHILSATKCQIEYKAFQLQVTVTEIVQTRAYIHILGANPINRGLYIMQLIILQSARSLAVVVSADKSGTKQVRSLHNIDNFSIKPGQPFMVGLVAGLVAHQAISPSHPIMQNSK
jgi:hypothetical protein